MVNNDGASTHQGATDQYQNGNYEAAATSFYKLRKSNGRHVDDLHELSVRADEALCRFRAATDAEFQKEVLYREAIRTNQIYFSKLWQRRDLLEAGLLSAISAVWIHTKMDNLKMARHKAWDALQWAVSISSPAETEEICSIHDSFLILSQSVQPLVLRKFRLMFDVLDLVQDKNVALLVEKERSNQLEKTKLSSQEDAVAMLARRRLGLAAYACADDNFGISSKLRRVFQAIDEPHEVAKGSEDLFEVLDHSVPSDLNLLGRFQSDCKKSLLSFGKALAKLGPGDTNIHWEIAFNLADCFARLGEHDRAKDLLLWLQGKEQLTAAGNTISLSSGNFATSIDVLWRAFVSATLDDDLVSTLAVSDLLNQAGRSKATALALEFSLHNAGRSSLATRHSSSECKMSWAISENEEPVLSDSHLGGEADGGVVSACFHNNRGLMFVGEGDMSKAILSFERACADLKDVGPRYLHPYYNLTLLLWAIKQPSRAVDLWVSTRSLVTNDASAIEEQLNSALAKYAEVGKVVSIENSWIANGEGGLPLGNILLLDCLVLQYRMQEREDRALDNLCWRVFHTVQGTYE